MDSSLQRRVLETLEELLALSPAAREARLAEFGARDPAAAVEVRSLLAVDAGLAASSRVPWNSPARILEDEADLTGAKFDGYEIVRELASGGMGRVFEALQAQPRRRVAIKVVRRGLATAEILRRFEYEAEVLARLDHPNIAKVFGAGVIQREGLSLPYFAMELVEGARTLADVARELDLRAMLTLFLQVCAAVEHGHQRSIVHRDLKPQNVLVGADGRPRLIDFGVAKAVRVDVARSTMHTLHGELLGTIAYMSPEQLDGDDAAIDARADVYGLGATLYELIAGRPPFDVDGLSLARALVLVRTTTPAAPGTFRARVPRDLDTIVLKALERDRDRRYGSVSALAADLQRFLAGEPIEARPPSTWERLARWISRHPVATTASACVLLVATGVAALFTVESYADTPHHVAIDSVRRVVDLIARNGAVLHSWDAGGDGRITLAQLVARPETPERGALVVVGYGDFAAREGPAGALCAYETVPPFRLAWSSKDSPLVPPPDEPYRPEANFIPISLRVADVFADVPGQEVVICHRLSLYSAIAVRVFDLEGRERYRAWHDGVVYEPVWLAEARQLVTGGALSETPWDRLYPPLEGSAAFYPIVALALEPRDGHLATDWVVRAGKLLDPTLAWYRWLGPPEHLDALGGVDATVVEGVGDLDPGRHAYVHVPIAPREAKGQAASLNYFFDSQGEVVRSFSSDSYKARQRAGKLPPFEAYAWRNLSELPRPAADPK